MVSVIPTKVGIQKGCESGLRSLNPLQFPPWIIKGEGYANDGL